ncbi:MAG: hypothetical protein SH856_04490 [Flavobacteriales bacterium]|nr:hypothetical protein [Flavobacteriales bacterium]
MAEIRATTRSEYYLTYTDGSEFTYPGEGGFLESLRSLANDNNAAWYNVGMDFELPGNDFADHLYFQVTLPIDSTSMILTPIDTFCLLNDSVSWTNYGYEYPGSIKYEKVTGQDGTDVNVDETSTSEFYNKITSVEYVGNHRYDQIEQLLLCDYEVSGEFKMRIVNDITQEIRILDNGQYKIKVSVIAQ